MSRLRDLCAKTWSQRDLICGPRSGTLREREAAALALISTATELANELNRLACEEEGFEPSVWQCDGCGRRWSAFTNDYHPQGRCLECGSAFAYIGGTAPVRCARTR